MRRELFALFLVGVLVLSVVASGCIGGTQNTTTSSTSTSSTTQTTTTTTSKTTTTSSTTTTTTTTTTTSSASAQKVTIVIWHAMGQSEAQVYKNLIAEFEVTHPNIVIKMEYKANLETSLKAAIPAGKGPDLFIWAHDWIGKFAEGGMLKPIDNYVTPEFVNQFMPVAQEAMQYKGHYYAVPIEAETVALIYNKKMVSQPPKTFAEMQDIMKKYYNPDKKMYGLASSVDPYFLSAWAQAFGGYYFNDKTEQPGLNLTATYEGFKFFFDNVWPYMAHTTDYNTQVGIFIGGNAPMMINGPWSIAQVKEKGIDFGVAPLPPITVNGTTYYPRPYAGVKLIYVSANAPDQKMQAIWTFLKWISSNESAVVTMALQNGYVPVLKSAANNPDIKNDPVISGFMAALQHAYLMPKSPKMAAVWGPVSDAITAYISGKKSLEQALQDAQKAVLKNMQG